MPAPSSPVERALLAWLLAVISIGAGWLAAVVLVDPGLKRLVAAGGGGLALALALAVAVAAYHATVARNARTALASAAGDGGRLEHRLYELCDRTMPALVSRVRDGATAEAALAELPPVPDGVLHQLLTTVARDLADARQTVTAARAATAAVEDDLSHLLETTLPAMAERVRADCASSGTLRELFEPPSNEVVARLQEAFAEQLARTQEISTATALACTEGASRIQARVTELLASLSELEHRYDDQSVFGDLLDLDHRVSQLGRLADTVAVLGGGRPGRRWTAPIPMESVLRGAMGRIDDYRRIRPHNVGDRAISGHAAEAVMHALAELLDNATSFAPRDTDVHVYVEEEDAGLVITVEDGGPGMSPRERSRAERVIADPDLTTLPGTRLGLAVVGRLAQRHGLRVGFRPSARGGVGVVILIPHALITRPDPIPFPDPPPAIDATIPDLPVVTAALERELLKRLPTNKHETTNRAAGGSGSAHEETKHKENVPETTRRETPEREATERETAGRGVTGREPTGHEVVEHADSGHGSTERAATGHIAGAHGVSGRDVGGNEAAGHGPGGHEATGRGADERAATGHRAGTHEVPRHDVGGHEPSGRGTTERAATGHVAGARGISGHDMGGNEAAGHGAGEHVATGHEGGEREPSGRGSAEHEAAGHVAGGSETAGHGAGERAVARHEGAEREGAEREAAGRGVGGSEDAGHGAGEREAAGRGAGGSEAVGHGAGEREVVGRGGGELPRRRRGGVPAAVEVEVVGGDPAAAAARLVAFRRAFAGAPEVGDKKVAGAPKADRDGR